MRFVAPSDEDAPSRGDRDAATPRGAEDARAAAAAGDAAEDPPAPRAVVSHWPQIDRLERLDEQYPDSRFVLSTRDAAAWEASVRAWGTLHARLVAADIPGLPAGVGAASAELRAWKAWHEARVERFFAGETGGAQGGSGETGGEHGGSGETGGEQGGSGETGGARRGRRGQLLVLDVSSADAPHALGAFLCAGGWLAARAGAGAPDECPLPWWGAANAHARERWHEGVAYPTACEGAACVLAAAPD